MIALCCSMLCWLVALGDEWWVIDLQKPIYAGLLLYWALLPEWSFA